MPRSSTPDTTWSCRAAGRGPERGRPRGRGAGAALFDWVVVIGVALLVAFLVRTFVLAHFVVDGESMLSTLHAGDRVFVNKLSYRLHDPNRGDVVVLHEITGASERDLIKRVIAPARRDDRDPQLRGLHRRPRASSEPYLDPQVVTPGNCGGDVAADHGARGPRVRDGRQPRRLAGQPGARPDPEDDIVGRAFVVFWPKRHWQWL